ncbi:MAG: transcriptional regulator, TetR family [Acidimicrobiaceae bacterium]|nr:transcriptional regulator, TetR family [Acidimicrobiaceae bacterium]
MSAEERRDQIIAVAVGAFARGGLEGTSTEKIAAEAGISQPYLFRLFPTKVDLFLATVERCFDRVQDRFAAAADGLMGQEAIEAMGASYASLIADRNLLRLQLHAYASAAAGEGPVRDRVRERFLGLVEEVRSRTGLDEGAIQEFFAIGMLCNLVSALGPEEQVPLTKDMSSGLLALLVPAH